MKYHFKAEDSNYAMEHDRFVENLINNSLDDLKGIIYTGILPKDCVTVKFSDYLNLNGCVAVPEGFCGIFGTKSYSKVLREFIYESYEEYKGTNYKLDVDVLPMSDTNGSSDISFYVDNLMVSEN